MYSKIGHERSFTLQIRHRWVRDRSIRGSRRQREKSGEVRARSNFLEGHEGAGGGGGGGRFEPALPRLQLQVSKFNR